MKNRILAIMAAGLLAAPMAAQADVIEFDPGATLSPFTTNWNDAYALGRGMWFRADEDLSVLGAGFYNGFGEGDAFAITLWTASSDGSVLRGTNLGSILVDPAAGTGFEDGVFASSIALTAGSYYSLEVTSASAFDRNYFFCFSTTATCPGASIEGPVSLAGGVTLFDGYLDANLANYVSPYVRLNVASTSVPEPGTLALLGLGLAGLGFFGRRKAG